MDSGNSSCSRTRSGLVRTSNMDLSDDPCSRTRSGLVRRKSFMGSSNDSCSRTRSGLVRQKSSMDSSDGSCSRTRSGLARRKSFMDSGDGSCSMTRSGLVRESPSVKALIMDGSVRKGLPVADGHLVEETPSRTRSGLVRQRPIVKKEDIPIATRCGLVRENPAFKIRSEDEPAINGLTDGWLKEDKPFGTRSGPVRGSLVMTLTKVESVTKGQNDGWLKDDKPVETQSGIVQGSHSVKDLSKDESVTEGLPDGWRKEYRPRKHESSQKNDPYYIDPVSGYGFHTLKDVHRYLQTGDMRQCAMRPKKGTLYDVCITENQTHTSSLSQQTRPGTADKGIQCEILTSEGITLPWEELYTPHREKNTEDTMSPVSESTKAIEGYGNKVETSQENGVQPFMVHRAPRQTESTKRKDQNVEVKSKKRKSKASPTVTPLRVSPRLAALNAQSEANIEPEGQPISINHINQLQSVKDNNNDLTDMNQSSTMNKIHGNKERTFSQLWSDQENFVNRMQAMQEHATNPSQVDTVNHIQMNLESSGHQLQSSLADTGIPMLTVHGYTTDQPSQADSMNHKQTNVENTVNRLQSNLADTADYIDINQEHTAHELLSSLEDTVISIQPLQEYNTYQPNRAGTMNHIKSSLADTITPIHSTMELTSNHSQPSSADSMNGIQANQRNTADELQLGQADTVTQIQMFQDNMTNQPQLSQANSLDQIQINLEKTNNHLGPNYAENPLLQTGFSWDDEQDGGSLVTDFWMNVESQGLSVPMQTDGVPVASFPANVKFQSATAPAAAEPVIPITQATIPLTVPGQSGLAVPSLFGNAWSDPCIEFAFKTLTGDIPVLDDTAAVTDYFPQQPDLNKGTTPNSSASALDNSRTHTQIDVNLPLPTQVDVNIPLPRPSDKLYKGGWYPPQ